MTEEEAMQQLSELHTKLREMIAQGNTDGVIAHRVEIGRLTAAVWRIRMDKAREAHSERNYHSIPS